MKTSRSYATKAFCHLSGYKREELLGKNHRVLKHKETPSGFYKGLWETISKGKTWHGEIKNRRKNGETFIVLSTITPVLSGQGDVAGYIAIRQDITYQVLSLLDPLTNIYNKLKFNHVLEVEIQRAKRINMPLSLVLLDLDNFKAINDTYGHGTGDEVLKTLTQVIAPMIRPMDTFARWGGEEFAILLPHTDGEGGVNLCHRIREALVKTLFPKDLAITASFGVARFAHDQSAKGFFDVADKALYQAKQSGKNRICQG